MQQQQRPPSLHHTPRSYTKLATTPPPLHTPPTALAIKRAPCVWSHSPRDGWRRGVAAARFPAKTPAWTAAAKAHHRPVFPKRGEMSRRNARADRPNKSDSSACFRSKERQGGGVACPHDWRTRMKRARRGRGARGRGRAEGRSCGGSARGEQSGV